jgi:cysteine desulfurase
VLSIHGLGVLARLAREEELWPLGDLQARWDMLRERVSEIDGARTISPPEGVFPNTLSLAFADLDAETVLTRLDMEGIAASSGSACSWGAQKPSTVLRAMGREDREIRGAIRLSFGPDTCRDTLEWCVDRLGAVVQELRRRRS